MSDELSAQEMLDSVQADLPKTEETPQATEQAAQTPSPTPQIFKYKIEGGKEIEEPLEMVLKRAGMGYHYAQKMHHLNQEMERFKQIEERNKALSRWEEFDKYAKENPQWRDHWENAWNNKHLQQGQDFQGQDDPKVKALMEDLADLKKFKDEVLSERQRSLYERQDSELTSEIAATAKQYNVDFDQADEEGKSLEWKVLEHAGKLGLNLDKPGQFMAAFKDYYFDNLVGQKKEAMQGEDQKKKAELKRAGILDISRTPKADTSKGYRPSMSWNDVGEAALQEYRQLTKQA